VKGGMLNNRKEIVNKLCLGAVLFGLDYGIIDKKQKIPKKDVFEILRFAYEAGINTLDTANAYGESEETIGLFLEETGLDFKIISKLPPKITGITGIEDSVYKSLVRLKKNYIDVYLVHKFDVFWEKHEMWDELELLKKRRVVKKIGFSIYKTDELEKILRWGISPDIIQLPYSLFDVRFKDYFRKLKERKIEISVRSIFMQGLVFMGLDNIPAELSELKDKIKFLQNIAVENNIPVGAVCMAYALLNEDIDKVIIGVASLDNLKSNLKNVNYFSKIKNLYGELEKLKLNKEKLLLPHKWLKNN